MRSWCRLRAGGLGWAAEGGVDRLAGPVLRVRPEMGVGVEGLHRALVAEALLHHLDRLAVADEKARVVVAQVVECRSVSQFGGLGRGPPDVREPGPAQRPTRAAGEDEGGRPSF